MNRLDDDIRAVLRKQADAMSVPTAQPRGTTMTLISSDDSTTGDDSRRRWWVTLAVAAAGAIIVGGIALVLRDDPDDVSEGVAAPTTDAAQGSVGPDPWVTEEVEPGVERIISDGAGHDLEERHPKNRYDVDDVAVTADGKVVLWTSYNGSDNEANPPGGLVWTLGEPGITRLPEVFCRTDGRGVDCLVGPDLIPKSYLAGTPINAIAIAPDGTVWAVGGDGGENGGLYRITTG